MSMDSKIQMIVKILTVVDKVIDFVLNVAHSPIES